MIGNESPSPIKNDPAREAVDSLRGYSYQILRSIEAWIELPERQILVLEGAEDLDRVDASGALTEQVKDTAGSGNITLRSENALAAIGNFWRHCERNSGIAIQFRYLTTSGIGQERGDDLPLGVSGIESWQRIRLAPTSVESLASAEILKAFLLSRSTLPKSLLFWLAEASTETFISRVIEPFEWVTDQPGADALRRRLEAKLIEIGEPRGIPSSYAVDALAKLHLAAWANATDSSRPPLRRGDFLAILEAAGSVTIPVSQLMGLLQQITGASKATNKVAPTELSLTKPPRVPLRRFSRNGLEASIEFALSGGTTLIHGSTGMGKTMLAAAATGTSSAVGWLDLRDVAQPMMAEAIDAAANYIAGQTSSTTVVLDDFDAGDDPRSLLPALNRLRGSVTDAGGMLLITSAQRLPPRVASAVNLGADRTFAAPPFEPSEIESYLGEAGCPVDRTGTWSKIIHASTSGHPQLVDARIAALQQEDWPEPSLAELINPPIELLDVRAEARRLVAALSVDERELLCRASLVIGRISRTRMIAVARISPTLNEPGSTIDRVIGPWLELTDTSDLRMSPLLQRLGHESRGAEWAARMHEGIAWAWLTDRSLTASDVSTIMMHAVLCGRAGPLVRLLPSLLDAPAAVWEQIAEFSVFFTAVGVDDGMQTPFKTRLDTAVFRILQLLIATATRSDTLERVIDRAFQEADTDRPQNFALDFFDFLFAWRVMALEDFNRDVRTAVDHGLRFMRVAGTVRDGLVSLGAEGQDVVAAWPDLSPMVAMVTLGATSDIERFGEFLDVVESLPPADRRTILPAHVGDIDTAGHMLDRLWLSEIGKSRPDWTGFVGLLERTIDMAIDVDVQPLAVAAAAILVRTTDENLREAGSALRVADRWPEQLREAPRVLAAKAKVLWRTGAVADALAIYEDVLEDLDVPQPYMGDIFREAAIAAGRAKLWSLCALRFTKGAASLSEFDLVERRIGFLFDQGLALHLANDTVGAVRTFAAALDMLIEDGRDLPPEPLLSVRQYGSQAIKLVLEDIKGTRKPTDDDLEMFVGSASSLSPLTWGQQRPASTAILAVALLELSLMTPGGHTVAGRLATWLRNSRDGLVLATTWATFTKLAVVTLDMEPLVGDTIRELSYLAHVSSERDAGRDFYGRIESDVPIQPLTDANEALFYSRILVAIVGLLSGGDIADLPLNGWREDIPVDPSYERLRTFLVEVEHLIFGSDDPWPKVVRATEGWQVQAVAALAAITRDRTPAELITAHSLAAHYLQQDQIREFVASPLSLLVTHGWQRLCGVPALLNSPRISVPGIREAIGTTQPGWTRTKAVLISALSAVPSNAVQQVRGLISSLP